MTRVKMERTLTKKACTFFEAWCPSTMKFRLSKNVAWADCAWWANGGENLWTATLGTPTASVLEDGDQTVLDEEPEVTEEEKDAFLSEARPIEGWQAGPNENDTPITIEPLAESPSIDASKLHREGPAEAEARAERLLGGADEQTSPLLRYRWTSDFQADWKREIGHYLHTAERYGYVDQLVAKVVNGRKTNHATEIDVNDAPHLVLQQSLSEAQVTHYLTGTGFGFVAWDAETGSAIDIDVRVRAPDGKEVNVQVKASGSPGPVVHHVVPSNDERIIIGIEKAVRQLPRDRDQVGLIALTALTGAYLSIDCGPVVVHCVGATSSRWGRLSLLPSNVGKFFRPGWEHVSAVLMLDYMRGLDARGDHAFRYACTVLVNPKARVPVSPDWFPHARVLVLDSGTFRWIRGAPSDRISLPDGTPLDATE